MVRRSRSKTPTRRGERQPSVETTASCGSSSTWSGNVREEQVGGKTSETRSGVSGTPTSANTKKLWTIVLLEWCSEFLLAFALRLSRMYLDEKGNNPLIRFLRPDRPGEAFLPTMRVRFFIVLGIVLSLGGLYLTEDEYAQGHKIVGSESAEKVANASDFPVHIAFHNVGCYIYGRDEAALAGVTGQIRPGRFTAILGRSGSGKTTLANLILGRSRNFCDRQVGKVYMNGRPRSLEVILDRVGFVPQDDVLYPELTVAETLRFSAETRLPRFASKQYKEKVLSETLEMLGIQHLHDKKVGSSLSGGEIKRVSIGMELVTHPSVLIMDEPTSGLDSAAAYGVIHSLREIANRGVAVVAVLHQPTTRIYNLIDDLILLQNGRPVYVGPRKDVLNYFESFGYYQIPNHHHISHPEFLIDILAGIVHPVVKEDEGGNGDTKKINANNNNHNNTSWLYDLWMEHGKIEDMWKEIEIGWNELKKKEQLAKVKLYQRQLSSSSSNLGGSGGGGDDDVEEEDEDLENTCDENYPSVFRFWCYIIYGLTRDPGDLSYPVRPKPGLFYQVHLWFQTFLKIAWRRGIWIEALIVVILSSTVGFNRSYNTTWNRRALGGFFISISLSLCGLLGALFNDDVGPVRRAADSGMVLGAYEFALIGFTIFKAQLIVNLYAVCYFATLYIRNVKLISSYWEYIEFTHMLHQLYLCAHTFGALICVWFQHELYPSYVAGLFVFVLSHTFAFFTPSKNQVERDAYILWGTIDTKPYIHFLCSLSYVRYFMEAIMLWEPIDSDTVGRNSALRYFGYHRQHKTMCYTCLFAIWAANQAIRFLLFARFNRNVFNSLHDTPLFIIFVTKVVLAFLISLLIMILIHEVPQLRKAWKETAHSMNIM